jgi:isopenicillin-N epimerase
MKQPARSELHCLWALDPALTYLNHGSFGACPRVVLQEQSRLRELLESDPMDFFFARLPVLWAESLAALSSMLKADPRGMTFQVNASAGVNTVLRSLEFRPTDEILVLDHAYQACRNVVDYVAARSGSRTVVVRLPFPPEGENQVVDLVLAAVTDRTRLAMIDTVTSPTALRLPFERLTRELQARGVDVLVDAAHGVGIVPLDLDSLGAAYVAGNCHKWLCTPKGSGFLHIRANRRHLIHPLAVSHGYSADVTPEDRFRLEFDWPGTQDPTSWLCIPKAIEYLGSLMPGGWSALMARNHALALSARDILAGSLGARTRVPDSMLAAMATLEIPLDSGTAPITALNADPLAKRLYTEYGIQTIVFFWKHHGRRYLRVSAALYNTEDEYRYLAEALTRLGFANP